MANNDAAVENLPDSGEAQRAKARTAWGVIRQLVLVVGMLVLLFLIPTALNRLGIKLNTTFVDYLVVMLLGAMVGAIEIISRYQDAPFWTVVTMPGLFYLAVNALVAASALWMMRLFGWNLVPGSNTADPEVVRWMQVLTAGLGAMALFRSSLLVIGKEENETSIGPAAILQILLNATDKEVDRFRGQERARTVKALMANISYEDASRDLVLISQGLLQNLSGDDVRAIDDARKKIEVISADAEVRKYLLGLKIIDIVGEDVLRQAIEVRGKDFYRLEFLRRLSQSQPVQPDAGGQPLRVGIGGGTDEAARDLSPRLKSDAWKTDIEALKAEIAKAPVEPEPAAETEARLDELNIPQPPAVVG